MSILDEKAVTDVQQDNYPSKQKIIQNSFFIGSRIRNITYLELKDKGREFVLLLLSYELNFEPDKLDYYYRTAKKLQVLFQIPGWNLLLPNETYYKKKNMRKKIINLANNFKSELMNKKVIISNFQASTLNKAYKNFLWD